MFAASLVITAAGSMYACSSEEASGSELGNSPGGSGGSGASGGVGGGISITGGAGGAGPDAGGGGNPSDASAPDGEPPGTPTGCAPGTLSLSGMVEGAQTSIDGTDVRPHWSPSPNAALIDFLGGFGGLSLVVDGALQSGVGVDRLSRDVTYPAKGWIVTPAAAQSAGTFFCAGSGSVQRTAPGDVALNLNVVRLGSCPGSAVAGEVVVCHDSPVADECTPSLSGNVEGIAFSDSTESLSRVGSQGWFHFDSGLVVRFESNDLYLQHIDTGVVDRAIIVTPAGGPHGGAVYCAGPSTWSRTPGPGGFGDHETFTFRSLSKLGACTGATGDALSGCLRSL